MEVNVDSGIIVHFTEIAAFGELRLPFSVGGFRGGFARITTTSPSGPAPATADAGIRANGTVHQFDFTESILQQRVQCLLGGVDVAAAIAVCDAADADAVDDGIGLAGPLRGSTSIVSRPKAGGNNGESSETACSS